MISAGEFTTAQRERRVFALCLELMKPVRMARAQRRAWGALPQATNELTEDQRDAVVAQAIETQGEEDE
jgi:hypothetical protein